MHTGIGVSCWAGATEEERDPEENCPPVLQSAPLTVCICSVEDVRQRSWGQVM